MSFSVTEHLSIISDLYPVAEFYLTLLSDSFLSCHPQSNFHRILAANRCVLEAWGRDYILCWTALPLTCASMGKYNMGSIFVKLFFPPRMGRDMLSVDRGSSYKGLVRGVTGWNAAVASFTSLFLNTWTTKDRRINEHYPWLSHPLCWVYLANLVLC